ncbi:MAG TPA: glycosyltransferase, partial [Vicinamibacterales bacterium]
MRLLFFSNAYPQPSDPGRAVFNFDMVRHLAQKHDVRAVVPVPWTEAVAEKLRRRHRGREIPPGPAAFYPLSVFPPHFFTASRASWMDYSTRGAVTKALSSWRPDAVLAYWADPDGTVAMSVARRARTRGVIMVGGTDVLLLTLEPRRRAAIVTALRQADAVVAVSEHLRDRVIELGVPPEFVHVVRRPVDPDHFRPGDRVAARRHVGIATDGPVIVWAGRLVPVKAVDTLLEAFSTLLRAHPNARLFLLGSGPLRGDLELLAKSLGTG